MSMSAIDIMELTKDFPYLCFIKDKNSNAEGSSLATTDLFNTKFFILLTLMCYVGLMDSWPICISTNNSLQLFAARELYDAKAPDYTERGRTSGVNSQSYIYSRHKFTNNVTP